MGFGFCFQKQVPKEEVSETTEVSNKTEVRVMHYVKGGGLEATVRAFEVDEKISVMDAIFILKEFGCDANNQEFEVMITHLDGDADGWIRITDFLNLFALKN